MKKILVTGKNSYIGNKLYDYLFQKNKDNYIIEFLDMLDPNWISKDFKGFDSVFNVCAIVHQKKQKDEIYDLVNTELAIKIAVKAKECGIKQFIQMSTLSIFGIDDGIIDGTKVNPITTYGRSKLNADVKLMTMNDEKFRICIVRPPMVYGIGCKGNYQSLEKFAQKSPVFPSLKNKKDFIYIYNLTNFIKYAIDNELNGVFYPRDKEQLYLCDMIKLIGEFNKHKIHLSGIFNPFVKLLIKFNHRFKLIFSNNFCVIDDTSMWQAPYSTREAIFDMYKTKRIIQ